MNFQLRPELILQPKASEIIGVKAQLSEKLFESLSYLFFDVIDTPVSNQLSRESFLQQFRAIETYPAPFLFALNASLVDSAIRNDEHEFAHTISAFLKIDKRKWASPVPVSVVPFNSDIFDPLEMRVIQEAFSDDRELTNALSGPGEYQIENTREGIRQALNLMEEYLPDWHAEFLELVPQIILAEQVTSGDSEFTGASTFNAFGSLLLRSSRLQEPFGCLMQMLHESAHSKLFLTHLEDPVLLNEGHERYDSPLRVEPRPMEGLFHAVYVSARMAMAVSELAAAKPDVEWLPDLDKIIEGVSKGVSVGLPTVTENAKTSKYGQQILDELIAYGSTL